MKLRGRIALVTGASRGIGRAIALALAAEGAAVAVNYRAGEAQAQEVVREIVATDGRAITVQGDVADYGQAEAALQQTITALGGLHILVNNAGIARDSLIFNMKSED